MTVTEIVNCTRRSLKTISAQKQSAMKKLDARSDVELVHAFKIAEIGAAYYAKNEETQ